jgi:hypothetical protein
VRAFDERDARKTLETEHPDPEAHDPEHGQDRQHDGGTTEPAGSATVAGDEDRIVAQPHVNP